MEPVKTSEDFIAIYDQFSDPIFRHCLFKLSNRELAKDAMQDTFMKTWEYLAKSGEIHNPKAFLYRVANNLVIDQYRRRKKNLSLEEMREEGTDFPSGGQKEIFNYSEMKHILDVIEKLEPIYKDVLILRYIDDLSIKEIAEIIKESENVVSVRINRAIKKIQNFFDK